RHRGQMANINKKKAKLDHSVVSSALGTPKTRKPLPSFGRPRGRDQMQKAKNGKPNKKMIMTGLSTTNDSQRESCPNPLIESPPSVNVKSADSGDASPTTSETAAPKTLDTVTANANNLVFKHRDTITITEARKLLKTMVGAQMEMKNLPWKRKGVWSDEVLREMIQVLRQDKRNTICKEYTKEQKEARRKERNFSARVGKMARKDLEDELDVLWQWRVHQNQVTPEGSSQMILIKIKEGKLA
ncbi:hypothetical protein H0H93_012297, partial [Arthromyces matolae]